MRCPVCQNAIPEQAPTCVHCGFHLAQADRVFASVPVLDPFVNDFAGVLSDKDQDRLQLAIENIEHRFPQLRFTAILTRLPKDAPFATYLFWLFNRGNLVPQLETGAQCRLVMLGIDVSLARSFCMIGYGLEPFIPEAIVQEIADSTITLVKQGEYANAITTALAEIDRQFTAVCEALPKIYGLNQQEDDEPVWSGATGMAY